MRSITAQAVSHGYRHVGGFELLIADLELLLLLLVPPLHLFQLRVQTLGGLPQPRRLLLVDVLHLRRGRTKTALIRANPTSLDVTNG